MFRFHWLLEANIDGLARLITRQHGKTLAESRAELHRGVEMVEFAGGVPSLLIGEPFACSYGNGGVIFTQSGYAARQFTRHFNAGMIGVNVGVPAPMAWLPFRRWNESFFGDLHVQGQEGIQFYMRQKVTLSRWPQPADSPADPLWRQSSRLIR